MVVKTISSRRIVSNSLLFVFYYLTISSIIPCCCVSAQELPAQQQQQQQNDDGSGENVKWTPNPEDSGAGAGGPLPLSQQQRDQLTQLEQVIMNSQDPQATLQQAAQANNMNPQDLVDLLQRNRQDMQHVQGGGAGGQLGQTLPRTIIKFIGIGFMSIVKLSSSNPKLFTMIALSFILFFYLSYTAPKTGLCISTGRGCILSPLSNGYTTIYEPPKQYVNKLLENSNIIHNNKISPSITSKKIDWNDYDEADDDEKDGVIWHQLNRKSDLAQAITSQATIHVNSFLPDDEDDDDDDDEDSGKDDNESRKEEVLELLYDTGSSILSSRRFTEFVDSIEDDDEEEDHDNNNSCYDSSSLDLRLQISDDYRGERGIYAFLISKRLGDYGRYGLQPLKVQSEKENDDITSLTYSTLNGGFFDGRLIFNIIRQQDDDDNDEPSIVVQTKLCIPRIKGTHRLKNKKLAISLLNYMTLSIKKSIVTDVQKQLIRKKQSYLYHNKAKKRAKQKRHLRYINEKNQEEMARDRKRKWQRKNPDSTRYTPSNVRQRSPNNC